MHHHWSIAVTLVLALAVGVPAAACCEAALGEARADDGDHPADVPGAPPCHAPASPPAPVDNEPADVPCDDPHCMCDRSAVTACHRTAPDDAGVVPSTSSSQLLDALLHAAVIQPRTFLPHTFFDRHHVDEDAALRPATTHTLLSLSCQLTL